ncbi:TspO/MBR related protein [Sinobaca qinghaiensis]|uniref:TspO/MBR related protein n=1 Tax=Sinobaca qinghaiensis TaxID=342944 RepID=A0A419UZI6_9BACL|nr:tryptophan-rich sensory protein [Sinobaca qinghaiensis]RKD71084.1 TspO/MBR related protein [Sinobaca qinghaiensis]
MNKLEPNTLRIANAAAFVLVIIMNGLANALPLNNNSTGALSDRLNVLFTPAGYVFSIWGVIYLALLGWIVASFLVKRKQQYIFTAIGPWFLISSFFNIFWLFMFHYEQFLLTFVAMTGLLASLLVIYRRLSMQGASFLQKLPFSLYTGWVTVAFIVNVGIVFVTLGIDGLIFPGSFWTGLVVIIGTAIPAYVMRKQKDIIYLLVFVWAYFGIFAERNEAYPFLAAVAFIAALGILAFGVWEIWKSKGKAVR